MNKLWRVCDAANAAGMSVEVIRRYIDRKQLELKSCDHKTTGSGNHRALSRARIYQAAIAHELIRIGVTPAKAFPAAASFSDFGDASREPGRLYERGGTTLIINHEIQRVINANGDTPLRDILEHGALSIVLDVKKIVTRVNDILATKKEFLQ